MHIGAHAWSFQPTVHPSIRHPYLAPNQFYTTDFCMEFNIIVCSYSACPLPNSISLLITSASDRERTHPSCPAYPHPHPHQFPLMRGGCLPNVKCNSEDGTSGRASMPPGPATNGASRGQEQKRANQPNNPNSRPDPNDRSTLKHMPSTTSSSATPNSPSRPRWGRPWRPS